MAAAMTGLFEPEGLPEMLAEREAIGLICGGLTPAQARAQAAADAEAWRHQCEVRYVLRFRVEIGPDWRDAYLDKVERARGKAAADKLRQDCADQWALGSRGAKGDWR